MPGRIRSALPRRVVHLGPARHRGFSLVEVLVAGTVGIVLTLLALQVWQAGLRSQRAGDGRLYLEEQGQLALEVLGRAVRQAGHRHVVALRLPTVRAPLPFAVLGCTHGRFGAGLPHTVYPLLPAAVPCVASTLAPTSDALLVLHESGEPAGLRGAAAGEWFPADPTRAQDTTCQGNRLPLVRQRRAATPQWLAATVDASLAPPADTLADVSLTMSHFYVDTTPRDGLVGGRLMCVGIGRGGVAETPQPLVQGVEMLVLRWGVDRDGDGSVDAYADAAELSMADWQRVASVRLCLVLRGEVRGAAAPAAAASDCHGQPLPHDRALGTVQRRFSATVALRNSVRLD